MEYRRLGLSELRVSTVGMGCIQFGGKADFRATEAIVHKCFELGINYFDTANVYSDGVGEEYLGRALGARRKEIVLATKVGRVRMGSRRKLVRDSTPAEIVSAVEESLRRLGTDYVDLYQVHWPDPDTAIEDTMRAMEDLVRVGKVRYIGVCNYSCDDVRRAFEAFPKLVTLQSPYNMLRRKLEYDTFPFCVQHGISIIPYWPLEQGILAGGGGTERSPSSAPSTLVGRAAAIGRLTAIASRLDRPLAHLALAWLLGRPGVASVIPGASRPDQLEENCRVADWCLPANETQEVDLALASVL